VLSQQLQEVPIILLLQKQVLPVIRPVVIMIEPIRLHGFKNKAKAKQDLLGFGEKTY
jgi:hypothetical protein